MVNDKTAQRQLPETWVWTTLGDVCNDPQYGWTTSATSEGKLHLLRTTDITSGHVDWNSVPFCAQEPIDVGKFLVQDGDIVISRAGSVGYSYLIKNPKPAVFASYLIRFRPLIHEKYTAYFLQSPLYWESILEKKLGIAIPNVNASKLKQVIFPLPPLPEQQRIVAKIEELFTQLDAGVAALKRIRAALKRYKASVLKAACEGRLLSKGAAEESTRQTDKAHCCAPTSGGDLPAGWRWVTVEQACDRIVDCLHSTPKFAESGIYCVDSTWIKPGEFVFAKARFVEEKTFIERNRRMLLEAKDIVFSREGALLGVAVRIPENLELCLGQRMMVFRPKSFLLSEFMEVFLNSQVFRTQYAPLITGTASPHLNIGDIRNCRIPLPPLSEQHRIIAEVERRQSAAKALEATIEHSLARAAQLRQMILQRAFEGRLAPQDPTDEPAEWLLERIRAAQGAKETAKRPARQQSFNL